ncbi:transcriptional regulator [Streptomyces sp. JJ38]|uniref:transcriptional regulator n=1 Tax=Streptomyces sp. JJ38 TaxID=2738128 RepID=UPI001C55C25B|nr:transcriptional regulator [Streptomyces sp. JJ38]MBW1598140.1 transcriptional regulator [Streptomyces sp. JJ38]
MPGRRGPQHRPSRAYRRHPVDAHPDTATVKYDLREGLLPPGERGSATQAEHTEEHLRRLGLARALIQTGRAAVATARDVLSAIENEGLDQGSRLSTAVEAVPGGRPSTAGPKEREAARRRVAELRERLGWHQVATSCGQEALVEAVATRLRLGYPRALEELLPYAGPEPPASGWAARPAAHPETEGTQRETPHREVRGFPDRVPPTGFEPALPP